MKGKVYLVGAGPGDPELLTVKALRVLRSADVIFHDELVGAGVLALVPAGTQVHNVGKRSGQKSMRQEEINARLVMFASLGMQVVRLKGGDPLVFGRAGEEIEALLKAGIAVEIVPGITSGLAAAAAAQIPLTHRSMASAVLFVTGHHAGRGEPENSALGHSQTTQVIYMPGYDYAATVAKLVESGSRLDTPCAIVSQASTAQERVHRTTLEDLPLAPRLPAPTVLFVGAVVGVVEQATVPTADGASTIPTAAHVSLSLETRVELLGQEQSVSGD
jgi:uroporphyrin-III C-methyltransferase